MKIGVFDSGLGGLSIAQAIMARLPAYDYLYLGDTKRVPYGNRSQETIHEFVSEALNYLFDHDCRLVILACNTASAESLRKAQREYLPANYPERRVLGVIIPTVEAVFTNTQAAKVGLLATQSTVDSGAYERECKRLAPHADVIPIPAPLLVPLIENDGLRYVDQVLADYLEPLKQHGADALILGCTHYSLVKDRIRRQIECPVLAQDEIVPEKLADYLLRHPEIETELSKDGDRLYHVTDLTGSYQKLANMLASSELPLEKVSLPPACSVTSSA